jgi:hypothetical protein
MVPRFKPPEACNAFSGKCLWLVVFLPPISLSAKIKIMLGIWVGVFMERKLGRIGASLARIGVHLTNIWYDRFAPWLLGRDARDEAKAVSKEPASGQIKTALRACLRSTDRVMRESW